MALVYNIAASGLNQRKITNHRRYWFLRGVDADRSPHPMSETGYRSHFCPRELVEEAGGPVDFVTAWLETKDDGKPVQLSLL